MATINDLINEVRILHSRHEILSRITNDQFIEEWRAIMNKIGYISWENKGIKDYFGMSRIGHSFPMSRRERGDMYAALCTFDDKRINLIHKTIDPNLKYIDGLKSQ